jgi:hypothetical protein
MRHGVKEDYSPSLRLNVVFPIGFWTSLGPVTLLFLLISFFWDGNAYPAPVPTLHFRSL